MLKGVDLSTWQEGIDYNELKAQGINFAILRCGYGKDKYDSNGKPQKDEMFEEHYKGCKEAGILVGVYHYSYCNSPENAVKEAENCLSYIAGKQLDLPVFYDLEETCILNNCNPTDITIKFCDRIKQEGYDSGVYANLNWFNNYFDVNTLKNNNIKIWLAQWNDEITADFEVDIWQYTNNIFDTESNRIDGNYLLNTNLIDIESSPEFEADICKSLAVDVIFRKVWKRRRKKTSAWKLL